MPLVLMLSSLDYLTPIVGGVSSCQRADRIQNEANSKCQTLARTRYGDLSSITYKAPEYAITGGETREECTRRVLGECVDRKRVCNATFTQLECKANVCFPN